MRAGLWLVCGLGAAMLVDAAEPARAAPSSSSAAAWREDDIRASRVEPPAAATDALREAADPADLLIVPDGDGRYVTLVDDARLEIVRRVATRAMLPGPPRRSPDGRHAYVGSTGGWITKLDLRSLAIVTEVRAGLELRDFALSSDGRWLLAGNAAPHSVAIFDADLRLVKTFAATPRDAATTSRVAAVADAAPRSSFVVVLQDIPEIWEISYDPRAEDIYDGLVHDYRMGEGVPMRGFLNRKRSLLGAPLTAEARNVAFDPAFTTILGAAPAQGGGSVLQVVNLDVRRRIAALALAGMPRLDAAIVVDWSGRRLMAMPTAAASALDVVDLKSWQLVKTIAAPAPLHFLDRPAGGRFAWAVAAPVGAHGSVVMRLDPATLEAVADASAAPPRSCGAPVLGRAGRNAWMRPCAGDTDLVVHDAATLRPLGRLPLAPTPTRR